MDASLSPSAPEERLDQAAGPPAPLILQHHLFLLSLNDKLSLDPVTGNGIWAIEYAAEHPEATVTGVDLSPIQPEYVQPNCQFEVDNVEDDWTYSRKPDYVHGRAMFTCFEDPKVVFQKAYDALAPGGYFEMQDIYFKPHSNDGTTEGTMIQRINDLVIEEVGFEDVVENKFAWPVAIGLALLTRVLGMPPEEVELLLVDLRKDLKDRTIHSYFPVYAVYGRKPL
ncbi:putative methyltransferase tdiE [Hyphodiscus hymeniophilus]|uniref:Methyltransferase tdiE n=1 Tax=Hyphodiscus hymeniophilus TaxID=353542 RepID=A0A9P7B0W1_9HELO|nr:putative methyltransferase tdiE [Hyphodiscus hymeniophilus]